MTKKGYTSAVDCEVGERLRARRLAMGMSLLELGQRLGTSYQQVQKYEAGQNRMSAGRLSWAAKALNVPEQWLFGPPSGEDSLAELIRICLALKEQRRRRLLKAARRLKGDPMA